MVTHLLYFALVCFFIQNCFSISPESINKKQQFWKSSLNSHISNLELDEVKKIMGYKPDLSIREKIFKNNEPILNQRQNLPTNFDSREQWPGCVHSVLNQGQCGSCWAFGSTEALSDRFCIASNNTQNITLSVEELVSCNDFGYEGCNGGDPVTAYIYSSTEGLPVDSCFPYTAGNGKVPPCRSSCVNESLPFSKYYSVLSSIRWHVQVSGMQAELLQNGPMVACFSCYEDFLTYTSGVYVYTEGEYLGGHCIKIIGWGYDSESGLDYWLAQNSWGNNWGMNGYFMIERGVNMCDIEDAVFSILPSFAHAHSSGQEDDSHHSGHHDEVLPHPDFRQIIDEYPNLEVSNSIGSEKEKWIQSGNLAYYLNIQSVRTVTLPVQMSIIFIGFDGNSGKLRNLFENIAGFQLESENMNAWLEHIEHLITHSIVPVGEEQTTTKRNKTPFTHIEYSIHINVVKLCPLINTIIDDFLLWNARPDFEEGKDNKEHKDNERKDKYYVDAFSFSSLLNNLLEYLHLSNQYSLFILNPNSPVERDQIYGYRSGFSDSEITLLYKNKEFIAPNISVAKETPDAIPFSKSTSKDSPSQKVTIRDLVDESEEWANSYLQSTFKSSDDLSSLNKKIENCRNSEDEESPDCLFLRSKERLDILDLAFQIIENGTKRQKEYLYRVQNEELVHENCIVHSWIGHNRFAYIDLTAGPFQWGPTVAAEGVVSFNSLPKVPANSRFPNFRNSQIEQDTAIPNSQERYNLYKAEISLLEASWKSYCVNNENPSLLFCSELKQVIESRGHGNIISGEESEGRDASSKLDEFTAKLGWTISNSIHHLITPPSPLFQISYAKRVTFHVFIIKNHQEYNPRSFGYFSYESFKYEVAKLKLPTQEFSFNLKEIQMGSDSELSMAFSNSLKAAVIPRLNAQGHFFTEDILYVDSKEIQHYLQSVNNVDDHFSKQETWEQKHMVKHIPIFIFSLNTEFPVFVDKYYTSKAMTNMVIAVQSNFKSYPSRMACNTNTIFWDLRNPTKGVLASTALILGGIVPSHIGYNDAKFTAYQNWMWSIGDSPFSYTSFEYHFSSFHKDIAFRHYIVDAINESIVLVNEAVDILFKEKLNAENLEASSILNLSSLIQTHNDIKILWVEISAASEKLDYITAVSKLDDLFELSSRFKEMAEDITQKMEVFKCLEDTTNPANLEKTKKFQWLIPMAIAVDIAVLMLLFSYKSRLHKVKIN